MTKPPKLYTVYTELAGWVQCILDQALQLQRGDQGRGPPSKVDSPEGLLPNQSTGIDLLYEQAHILLQRPLVFL